MGTPDVAEQNTVDVVLVAMRDDVPHVLLIRRGHEPYAGTWALPGGYIDDGEDPDAAARRELIEETSVVAPKVWLRVGKYDDPDRDPRGRVVSVAYAALLDEIVPAVAGDDARDAEWVPIEWTPVVGALHLARPVARPLAFDHDTILFDALELLGMRDQLDLA